MLEIERIAKSRKLAVLAQEQVLASGDFRSMEDGMLKNISFQEMVLPENDEKYLGRAPFVTTLTGAAVAFALLCFSYYWAFYGIRPMVLTLFR